MKKLIILIIMITIITGCSCGKKEKLDKVTCELVSDQSASGYVAHNTYEIYSNKDIVRKVSVEEKYESKEKSMLEFFEEELNKQYKKAKEQYNGYEYSVKKEDNSVISKVEIDYKKVDLEKFIKENPAMKSYANDKNELTKDGIIQMYKNMGAECK